MPKLPRAALIGALSLLAVSGPRAESAPPYQIVTDLNQTMAWILNPAAEVIWDSAGTVITAAGSEELAPTTDEGWDRVLHAAATLAETGNLLMLPGRAAGDDWIRFARDMAGAGRLAMDAARARDPDALFEAGGHIYQACRACHDRYWVESIPPRDQP